MSWAVQSKLVTVPYATDGFSGWVWGVQKSKIFVTMPLTGVLFQCKINMKSRKFSGGFAPLPPNWGCTPDVDRSAVLYAILIGCKNVRYVGQINVGGKKYGGIKSSRGRLKPIRALKAYKKKQKKWRPFFVVFWRHPLPKILATPLVLFTFIYSNYVTNSGSYNRS